jgi:hypothetical protein
MLLSSTVLVPFSGFVRYFGRVAAGLPMAALASCHSTLGSPAALLRVEMLVRSLSRLTSLVAWFLRSLYLVASGSPLASSLLLMTPRVSAVRYMLLPF